MSDPIHENESRVQETLRANPEPLIRWAAERIENHYDDGPVKSIRKVEVPGPPDLDDDEATDEWAYEHLFPLTGTGRTWGDAAYFVRVTEAPDLPALVGREFEWGT